MKTTQVQAIAYQKGLMALAVKILMAKRKDYSGGKDPYANLRVAEAHAIHPVQGVLVRCNDKLVRVSNILAAGNVAKGGEVGDKVLDDLRDVINYVSIAAGLLAEKYPDIADMLLKEAETFDETMEEFHIEEVVETGTAYYSELQDAIHPGYIVTGSPTEFKTLYDQMYTPEEQEAMS